MQKPNEKLLKIVVILLREVIYAHFYNRDRPLDFVLVMYNCLNWSLKLHSGLWTIPHLILTHNTGDFVQIMSISFVWLYMFKCDVYAQILANQTQKYFWEFYMFLKVILYFHVSSFCSTCIFVFFHKKLVQRLFREKLAT